MRIINSNNKDEVNYCINSITKISIIIIVFYFSELD